jgi:SAM-dependent methyltransferase
MRQTVIFDSLYEEEVRPTAAYSRLRQLAIESARMVLKDENTFIDVPCPSCASADNDEAFSLCGYRYRECNICGTLYISPRPAPESMEWYLLQSPLAKFRISNAFRQERHEFIHDLAVKRADWIVSLCHASKLTASLPVIDIHERYPELVTCLARKISGSICTVMPLTTIDDTNDAVSVINSLKEMHKVKAQVIIAFDVFEHVCSPSDLVEDINDVLAPGGLFALTTRSGSGFDIQAIWGDTDTIFPLEHVNLISVAGMRILLERQGFDFMELSTPGQLDVQVVMRKLDDNKKISGSRILRRLILESGESGREDLQQLLQKHLLSSHMRVVTRKKIEI